MYVKRRMLAAVIAAMLLLTACGAVPAAPEAEQEEPLTTEETPQQAEEPAELPETPSEEQAFTSLDLEIKTGTLYIRAGDDFSLTRHDGGDVDYEIRDGTLIFQNDHTGDTVLTLPEKETYETLRLTVGEGHVYGESALAAQSLEVDMHRGEAALEALTVSDSSTVQVEQGAVFLSGDLGTSVTAECREGHLQLEVPFGKSEYNYELSVSQGDLSLGGEGYHGRSASKSIDNGSDRSMELICSRGELSVGFDGSGTK